MHVLVRYLSSNFLPEILTLRESYSGGQKRRQILGKLGTFMAKPQLAGVFINIRKMVSDWWMSRLEFFL